MTVPAGSITLRCMHCNGNTFSLHGPMPEGTGITKSGEMLPVAQRSFTIAECASCGEVYNFMQPRTVE